MGPQGPELGDLTLPVTAPTDWNPIHSLNFFRFFYPPRFSHKEYMTAEDLKAFLETEQGVRMAVVDVLLLAIFL